MRSARASVAVLLALNASPAWACTLCHSDTAARVRAEVLGPHFAANLLALAALVPALLVAVLVVRRASP